jgi:ABC-type dipeptide/oligopeptide/nickel transport system permease subunit
MIIPFKKKYVSVIGYFLGIIYCVFFNSIKEDIEYIFAFAYSVPFILFSLLIGIAISKLRKDKLSGIYFLICCLLLVSAAS